MPRMHVKEFTCMFCLPRPEICFDFSCKTPLYHLLFTHSKKIYGLGKRVYGRITPLPAQRKKGKTDTEAFRCIMQDRFTMKNRTPDGFTAGQWDAVTEGLDLNPNTVNDYRKVLNRLHDYNNGSLDIQTMTKEQAVEYFNYLDQLGQDGKMSPNTIHRYKATLRSVGSRIEKHPELWPDYVNPFTKLVTNESRKRTEYTQEMFADPEDIRKLLNAMPLYSREDRLIFSFMANIGMTSAQIQNVRISHFRYASREKNDLYLDINEGVFLEKSDQPSSQSIYIRENYPVRLVREAPGHTITWNYTGSFSFQPDFQDQLKEYYSYIGVSDDNRPFFLTARHLIFNSRAMHHMVLVNCERAGVDHSRITPNQISRFGILRSYFLTEQLARHNKYVQELQNADPRQAEEIRRLNAECEEMIQKLDQDGRIGEWKDRFPIPLKERVDSMKQYLGEEFLKKAAGL